MKWVIRPFQNTKTKILLGLFGELERVRLTAFFRITERNRVKMGLFMKVTAVGADEKSFRSVTAF
jgi:hypothetical protein